MRIYIFYHTKRGSALLISLIILILVTLLTTVFLEVILSSSKNVQGIEASNIAYYQAVGIIEEQLIAGNVSKKTPWNIQEVIVPGSSFGTGRSLKVQTGGSIMPMPGYGNSPYDPDYNIISLGEPVQIVIPGGLGSWNNVFFQFKVPKVSPTSGTGVANIMYNSGVILWTLGYTGASLYASGETQIFRGSHINTSTNHFSSFSGITNSGSNVSISFFSTDPLYLGADGAKCNPYNCTLKLSMIRSIMTSDLDAGNHDGRSLPFLEYKINFDYSNSPLTSSVRIPSQFMTLDASAYAYGFQRMRRVYIPQVTTNTALDFAILQ